MTLRLAALARHHWADIDGYAVSRNLGDLHSLDLGRFVNFVWWWATNGADRTEVERFRAKLWIPPKGEIAQGPWSAEAEQNSFAAFKAASTGKK